MLISCGVNGEVATQRFHQSPAHVAAFGSQPHCLMWLVQNGANVNAQVFTMFIYKHLLLFYSLTQFDTLPKVTVVQRSSL